MSYFTLLPVGTVLDNNRYVLIEDSTLSETDKHVLGKGGFGAVYLAEDTRLDCEVAVKQTTYSSTDLKAFRHEAALLANLRHHALPKVQDYFNDPNGYFIVMELVRGEDLEQRRASSGKMSFEEIKQITLKLLDVLIYLNSHNIVHKDIKPANLKLTSDGDLKVLDFGLAKGSAGLMTTYTSTILGGATPAYAPPEQLNGEKSTHQSDLYSAAVTIYHLATGNLPPHCFARAFAGSMGSTDPLQLLSDLDEEIPLEFAVLINQALSLMPANRPESAYAMKEQLLKWESDIESGRIRQRIEEAEKKLEDRIRREHQDRQLSDKEKASEFFKRGYKCYEETDYQGAIENYTVAIALNHNYASAYHNRGLAYQNKGDYDQAIKDYSEAIKLNSDYTSAYYGRGVSYRNKGDYDQAIKDYNEAIKLEPDYVIAYYGRGFAYKNKGDYDQAIKDYNEAIKLNPDYALAYNGRGIAYRNKGDYDQAIKDYSKAIKLNPDYADAYNNRGNVYYDKYTYDQAINNYDEAIRLNPDYATAYNNRGHAYKQKGELAKAEVDWQKAKELKGEK